MGIRAIIQPCAWRQRTRAEPASFDDPASLIEVPEQGSGQSSPLAFRCFARARASGLDMPLMDGDVYSTMGGGGSAAGMAMPPCSGDSKMSKGGIADAGTAAAKQQADASAAHKRSRRAILPGVSGCGRGGGMGVSKASEQRAAEAAIIAAQSGASRNSHAPSVHCRARPAISRSPRSSSSAPRTLKSTPRRARREGGPSCWSTRWRAH